MHVDINIVLAIVIIVGLPLGVWIFAKVFKAENGKRSYWSEMED